MLSRVPELLALTDFIGETLSELKLRCLEFTLSGEDGSAVLDEDDEFCKENDDDDLEVSRTNLSSLSFIYLSASKNAA